MFRICSHSAIGFLTRLISSSWSRVRPIGELLAKLGLTPQKPLQRAYQRDPEAIEAWRHERYPAIARQAKASGGEVYFWDESGFRADSVHGKTVVRPVRSGNSPVMKLARPGGV